MIIRPPYGWSGGKQRQLPHIVAQLPARFTQTYYEPFLGGGSLLLDRLMVWGTRANYVASDINDGLINFWVILRDDHEGLFAEIEKLCFTQHDAKNKGARSKHFRAIQRAYNTESERRSTHQPMGSYADHRTACTIYAAQFLYLVRNCYGNIWQTNNIGHFTSGPSPKHTGKLYEPENLRTISRLLQKTQTKFLLCDAFLVMKRASHGDLVYCDPPYDNTKNAYIAGVTKHDIFYGLLIRELKRAMNIGLHVALSNTTSERIMREFSRWRLVIIEVKSRQASNACPNEILILSHGFPGAKTKLTVASYLRIRSLGAAKSVAQLARLRQANSLPSRHRSFRSTCKAKTSLLFRH